jgi:capsular polysaccharide biosynthesis protein
MEIGPLLPLFRRRWWILVAIACSAGVLGWVAATRIPPTYTAESTMLVGPMNGAANTVQGASLLVATYADLATSASVLDAASRETGVNLTAGDGPGAVRVTGNDTTRMLSIRVELEHPADAVRVVGSITNQLLIISAQSASLAEGQLHVVDAATDALPVPPKTPVIALLAGAAGLIAAALVVIGLEIVSPAVRTEAEAERIAEVAVLVVIQGSAIPRRRRTAASLPPMHPDYALLAAHLLARDAADSTLVVSAGPREGVGELVLDLARAIAATGRPVTIIPDEPADALVGADHIAASRLTRSRGGPPQRELRLTDVPGIDLAVSGLDSVATSKGLRPQEQIVAAAEGGRFVIIDGGAVDGSTAATRWCQTATSTLLLVRLGATDRRALTAAARTLRAAGAERLDLVTLGFPTRIRPPYTAIAGHNGQTGTAAWSHLAGDGRDARERSLMNRPPVSPE